jgi:hypothetical protein
MTKKIEKGCTTCKYSAFEKTETGRIMRKVAGRCIFKVIPPAVPWFREDSVARASSSGTHGIWPGDGKECKCWEQADTAIISLNKFPIYVKLINRTEDCCAVVHVGGGLYWRNAGHWNVQIEHRDGKLIAIDGEQYHMSHMDGKEVYPSTRKEWANDNKGYTGGSDMLREFNSRKEDKNREIPF